MAGHHKFLLQPQLFLKVFQLGQKVDQFHRNRPQALDHAKRLFNIGKGAGVLHIVQVHDFVLDVEVQLTPQKAAQVLVNEVIGGILCGVVTQVFFQQGALGVLFGRRTLAQAQPAGFDSGIGQHGLHSLCSQHILLGAFGCGLVFKTDDEFFGGGLGTCHWGWAVHLLDGQQFLFKFVTLLVDAGHRFGLNEGKSALFVVVFAVVFGGVCSHQAEMDFAAVFELEAVVGEVFAALGVVLVFVGPVQHHLFTSVGNGVGIALVAALADEVAVVKVA